MLIPTFPFHKTILIQPLSQLTTRLVYTHPSCSHIFRDIIIWEQDRGGWTHFLPHDYALRLNGKKCVFYVPNLYSLVPTLIWPGTKGKRKVPTRSEATVGEFEDASGWEGFQLEYQECLLILASPLSRVADPSRACTAKVTQWLKRVDGIFGIYSSPLEPLNDVEFVEIKTTENTLQYSKPPYKFTYACRSHDRVQPPLGTRPRVPILNQGVGIHHSTSRHQIIQNLLPSGLVAM